MGRPVTILWRKRRWVCPEPTCPVGSFVEQDERIATPRGRLTARACWWAIEQIRREHASGNGIRRQLGTSWSAVWDAVKPLLQHAAEQESRFPACQGELSPVVHSKSAPQGEIQD